MVTQHDSKSFMANQQRSAANAYRRHDSAGFSSLDKSDPLAEFGDSAVSEIEKGVIDVSTEVHTTHTKHPNHTAVVETCPTAITETSNCSADSPVEEVDHETLETRAIRKFYPDLSNAISQELGVISTELYSCGLIERTKLDQILAVLGISDHSKAVMVLNAALSKMEVLDTSKFHEFLQILGEHGIQEIAEQIRTYFDEQLHACEHRQRLSPVGGSDSELMCNTRPSSAGVRETGSAISHLRSRPLQSKKHYQRETSHPNLKTRTKSSGQDVQDESTVQRQVRQLNVDVLKLNKENRKLKERVQEQETTIKEQDIIIKEQDSTIKDLENDYQELLARYENLKMQKNILLTGQHSFTSSLLSLTDQEDTDYHPLAPKRNLRVRILSGWAGCQACYLKGNTHCKESTV